MKQFTWTFTWDDSSIKKTAEEIKCTCGSNFLTDADDAEDQIRFMNTCIISTLFNIELNYDNTEEFNNMLNYICNNIIGPKRMSIMEKQVRIAYLQSLIDDYNDDE